MKIKLALLSATSILLVVGIILLTYALKTPSSGNDAIYVDFSDKEEDVISFDSLALVPGDSCTYTVYLRTGFTDTYNVTLAFVAGETTTLGKDVCARVAAEDGTVLCDAPLATLFTIEAFDFSCELADGKDYALTVTYYMSEDVGNEAKNAEVIFDLKVTASNE